MRDLSGRFLPENPDMWDPRFWPEELPWKTITLSSDGEIFVLVDRQDKDWLDAEGPWNLYEYRGKKYAKRTRRKGEPGTVAVYMHRRIAERHIPKSKHKTAILVDHKDSDGLNNRRNNLAWVTPQQNRLNLWGMWWAQKDFLRELERA